VGFEVCECARTSVLLRLKRRVINHAVGAAAAMIMVVVVVVVVVAVMFEFGWSCVDGCQNVSIGGKWPCVWTSCMFWVW